MSTYTGNVVELPVGVGGLDKNTNPYNVSITNLTKATNVRFYGNTWTKAPGLAPISDTATGEGTCQAGHNWRPVSGTNRQITCWSSGKIFKETGGDIKGVELASGLTLDSPISLVDSYEVGTVTDRKLYIFSKNMTPQVLVADGNSLSAITDPSTDWASDKPAGAFYHDLRTIAYGLDAYPHLIYMSTIEDQGDFVGSGSKVFSIQPSVGDKIIGGIEFLPQAALVFKYPAGIVLVDTSDVTSSYLNQTVLRRDIGAGGPNLIAKVGSDVLFVSGNGRLYSLQALRPDVDPIQADITEQLNLSTFIEQNVDLDKLEFGRLVYDSVKQELHYYFTSKSGTSNDMGIIFDLSDQTPKASIENRGNKFQSVWVTQPATDFSYLTASGDDGLVYNLNSLNKADNGQAYLSEFEYPQTDLSFANPSLASVKKRFDWLEVWVEPTGAYDMKYDIQVDAETVRSISHDLTSGSAAFDSAEYDVDEFAGREFVRRKIRIGMIGYSLSIRGYNETALQDYKILKMLVHFDVLGSDAEA